MATICFQRKKSYLNWRWKWNWRGQHKVEKGAKKENWRDGRGPPVDWIACWLLTCLQMKILLMVGQDKLKAGLSSCPPDLVVAIETSSISIFLYYYTFHCWSSILSSCPFSYAHTPAVECSPNDRLYSLFSRCYQQFYSHLPTFLSSCFVALARWNLYNRNKCDCLHVTKIFNRV